MNSKISPLILASMVVVLTSCGSSSADDELSDYIYEIKIRKGKPITPIPDFVPVEKFIYPENDARRSPFIQKDSEKVDQRLAPNTKRPKQPLEQYALDSLKFVGTLKEGDMVWGLVIAPGGGVTRVKIGDYMGKDFGMIIGINDTSLKIEETVQVAGKWERKITTFNLNASK